MEGDSLVAGWISDGAMDWKGFGTVVFFLLFFLEMFCDSQRWWEGKSRRYLGALNHLDGFGKRTPCFQSRNLCFLPNFNEKSKGMAACLVLGNTVFFFFFSFSELCAIFVVLSIFPSTMVPFYVPGRLTPHSHIPPHFETLRGLSRFTFVLFLFPSCVILFFIFESFEFSQPYIYIPK